MLPVVLLVEDGVEKLRLNVDAAEDPLGGAELLQSLGRDGVARLVVAADGHQDSGVRREVLHQSRGNFGKIGRAPSPGHVL